MATLTPNPATTPLGSYLQVTDIIDWAHPAILALAKTLASPHPTPEAIARACFTWVRDQIYHSSDHQLNPVTCQASEVLHHRTGYCFAKSHLLAALLRANDIPAGFCYQRLSVDDIGPPYCLHGLNAVYLPRWRWYRLDARGNRADVQAQFTPPVEQLAYTTRFSEEANFPAILPDPLDVVVTSLQTHPTWDYLQSDLPDVSLEQAKRLGLYTMGAQGE